MTQDSTAEVAALYSEAVSLHQAGQLSAAAARYREVLKRQPSHFGALHMMGVLAFQHGDFQEAVRSIDRALEINPRSAAALINRGLALQDLQQSEEALASFDKALAINPDAAEAHCNRGTVLNDLNRYEESLASYNQALALKPDYFEAQINQGAVLQVLERPDEALRSYDRALALKPDFADGYNKRGVALQMMNRLDEAIASFDRALAIQPDFALAFGNKLFTLHYLSSTHPATLLDAHRRYAEQFEAPLRPLWPAHTNRRDPERRLKVGYVSADFRLHSVAFFMEPLLAHHDKRAVEVYCYYNHTLQDAVNERLQAHADHWIPCKDLSDAELAARIQADGIDILVDLTGHTRGNRLLVFARKPAPVQVTYLGYPATTGLSAIDYRLVTADTDPPGAEAWHSERLYRLPRSLWCYRPSPDMPAVIPTTAARRNGFITFGAMNNVTKVSDAAIATWARLLKTVPTARLIMTNLTEGARRVMHERFAAHGIAPARFILHGKLPAAEYYALLNTIDIALDPFPYTGTTTTCESLWMGVPVVTLIGETSVARSGYALLKGIGLEALAAGDEKEYVAIAAALAQDLERLDALRGGMRQRIASSPLRDEAGLTRDLEAAYRAMWRAWCET